MIATAVPGEGSTIGLALARRSSLGSTAVVLGGGVGSASAEGSELGVGVGVGVGDRFHRGGRDRRHGDRTLCRDGLAGGRQVRWLGCRQGHHDDGVRTGGIGAHHHGLVVDGRLEDELGDRGERDRPGVAIGERGTVGLPIKWTDGVDIGDVVGKGAVVTDAEPADLARADGDGRRGGPQAGGRAVARVARSQRDAVIAEEPTGQGRRHQDHGYDRERRQRPDRRPRRRARWRNGTTATTPGRGLVLDPGSRACPEIPRRLRVGVAKAAQGGAICRIAGGDRRT